MTAEELKDPKNFNSCHPDFHYVSTQQEGHALNNMNNITDEPLSDCALPILHDVFDFIKDKGKEVCTELTNTSDEMTSAQVTSQHYKDHYDNKILYGL